MLAERSNIPGRLRCTFRSNLENDASLPVGIRQDLLRIAQEAISNALRHARPTAISVIHQTLFSKSKITGAV
jgi:signal transduction histidine kinase